MKAKKRNFFVLTVSYFLITAADLTLTYIATPDLEKEGNPLVTNLSFGWSGLIAVNVITYLAFFAMAFYAYIVYKSPASDEVEVMRYLSDITYDDPEKGSPGMLKKPKHWAPQIACLCYSVSTALPFSRIIIVLEWALLLGNVNAPVFFSIVAFFPLGRIDFFIAVILAWGLSVKWIYSEFKANKKRLLNKA